MVVLVFFFYLRYLGLGSQVFVILGKEVVWFEFLCLEKNWQIQIEVVNKRGGRGGLSQRLGKKNIEGFRCFQGMCVFNKTGVGGVWWFIGLVFQCLRFLYVFRSVVQGFFLQLVFFCCLFGFQLIFCRMGRGVIVFFFVDSEGSKLVWEGRCV